MTEESFSLKEYIREMDERHTKQLDAILAQATKTNGRVSNLENWRNYVTGAVTLAVALGIPNLVTLASRL